MAHAEARLPRPEERSFALIGAVLAAALVLFFCVGHLSHGSMGMGTADGLAHGVGVCLLAAMVLVAAPLLPARQAHRVRLPLLSPAPPFVPAAAAFPAAPARASPAWLQRFRD